MSPPKGLPWKRAKRRCKASTAKHTSFYITTLPMGQDTYIWITQRPRNQLSLRWYIPIAFQMCLLYEYLYTVLVCFTIQNFRRGTRFSCRGLVATPFYIFYGRMVQCFSTRQRWKHEKNKISKTQKKWKCRNATHETIRVLNLYNLKPWEFSCFEYSDFLATNVLLSVPGSITGGNFFMHCPAPAKVNWWCANRLT